MTHAHIPDEAVLGEMDRIALAHDMVTLSGRGLHELIGAKEWLWRERVILDRALDYMDKGICLTRKSAVDRARIDVEAMA